MSVLKEIKDNQMRELLKLTNVKHVPKYNPNAHVPHNMSKNDSEFLRYRRKLGPFWQKKLDAKLLEGMTESEAIDAIKQEKEQQAIDAHEYALKNPPIFTLKEKRKLAYAKNPPVLTKEEKMQLAHTKKQNKIQEKAKKDTRKRELAYTKEQNNIQEKRAKQDTKLVDGLAKEVVDQNLQFLQSLAEDNESLNLPDLEENIDDFLHALSNAKEFDPKARGLKHKSKKYKKNKTIKKSKKSKRI